MLAGTLAELIQFTDLAETKRVSVCVCLCVCRKGGREEDQFRLWIIQQGVELNGMGRGGGRRTTAMSCQISELTPEAACLNRSIPPLPLLWLWCVTPAC